MKLELKQLIENIISSNGFLSQNLNQHTSEEIIKHNFESLLLFFEYLSFDIIKKVDNMVIMVSNKRNIKVTVSINKSILNSNVIETTVNPHDINSEKDFNMQILQELMVEYRVNKINTSLEALKEKD